MYLTIRVPRIYRSFILNTLKLNVYSCLWCKSVLSKLPTAFPDYHWHPNTILVKLNCRMIFFSVLVAKKLDYFIKNCAGKKIKSFLSTRYNSISAYCQKLTSFLLPLRKLSIKVKTCFGLKNYFRISRKEIKEICIEWYHWAVWPCLC